MEAGRSSKINGQGIKIQSQSSYEQLDPESQAWLNHLKKMWPLWKECYATTQMLFDFFSKSKNPYVSAFQIMIASGDFYSGKESSLAFNIMQNFSKWIANKEISYLLTKDLKLNVFNLIIKQKNRTLMKLVVETYKMIEDKEIFIEYIRGLIKTNMYKEACHYAVLLKLHQSFHLNEFIIPLVFQDKYPVAEEFLVDSKPHQIELATFLDNLLGSNKLRYELEDIVNKLNINEPNISKLYAKPLSRLVTRMVKSFDIPPSVCPNLTARRGKGTLQFLLYKRYVEKNIGGESWVEMVGEAVGDDRNLQLTLLNGVASYGDMKEALYWAERFGIPEEEWSYKLKQFGGRSAIQDDARETTSSEENWDDIRSPASRMKFHQLPDPDSRIILIDTPQGFSAFLQAISEDIFIVGIDAEWKPTFGLKKCDMALIQVSTFFHVYILDVMALGSLTGEGHWDRFASVLIDNPKILKLGFGLAGDLSNMRESLPRFQDIRTSGPGFLDLSILWKVLVSEYNFRFPYSIEDSSSNPESLNALIELCFGEKLDKSNQFSNWEKRPLRRAQIIYAALDAYCLLEAYNVMYGQAELQNIPIADVINEIMVNDVTPKKKKKKKKSKSEEEAKESEPANTSRISVSEFHVMCDTMLPTLGKELRKCGVDTIILEPNDEPSIRKFQRNLPLNVLTQRKDFSRLKKYGHVYCVKSDNLKQQVLEVLDYFNVTVTEKDVFTRCLACNCTEFDTYTQEQMKRLAFCCKTTRNYVFADEFEEFPGQFHDDDVYDFGDDDDWSYTSQTRSCSQMPLDRTRKGAVIGVKAIPIPVLDKVPVFEVCVDCGKCYWDKTHKTLGFEGFIGEIIKR